MAQQMAKPTPKVVAGTVAGAASLVLVWLAGLVHLDVPSEVAVAITVLLSAGAAYLRRDTTARP